MKSFPKNWLVRVYNTSAQVIDSWKILNRFEWEATREAEADVERMGSKVDDWSMTPIKN